MLSRLIVVLILQGAQISSHPVVYLKLTLYYTSIISINNIENNSVFFTLDILYLAIKLEFEFNNSESNSLVFSHYTIIS